MMPIIGLLVGAVVGFWLGHNFDALLGGAFVGLITGLVIYASRKRSAKPAPSVADVDATRFAVLEERVVRVEAALERAGLTQPAQTIAPQATSVSPSIPSADIAAEQAPISERPPTPADALPATSIAAASAVPAAPVYGARAPGQPNRIWAWLTGGNTLARVGIIVLFIGVGFLLKYAAEHVTVPIELRVAGVALGAVVLLLLGWRLRERRTAYAMILQGGGVGVLYLTVFSALKLYALLSPGAAFALLFVIAALSSWLAVRQDAIALAAVGVVGGFFAPILTSSGSGNHVVLFSYYALLNAGIFFVAWFKAWRLLNLLGFACTFIIGTLWGVTRYRQADFATTEPFLILFFLFYVGIAVLYALKRSVEVKHYVDGTIVFGTPLVAAGLQQALVRQYEFGMAASAVAASALYLVLARFLWSRRREDLRLLVESFLALGVVFATLAVPLAFDARWTSATWALEGAASVWVGVRQERLAARSFGLVLQLAAGVAFGMGSMELIGYTRSAARPLLNSEFVGAALIAAAGLLSAWTVDKNAERLRRWEGSIVPVVFAWGAIWWLIAGGREIDRFVRADVQLGFVVAFLSVTGLAFAFAAGKLRWPLARVAARLLLPLLLLCALGGITHAPNVGGHLFANGGVYAWPFAVLASFELLRMFDRDSTPTSDSWVTNVGHAGLVVLVTLLAADEIGWLAREFVGGGSVWSIVPWGLAPALALILICQLSTRESWPIATHRRAYLVVAAFVLVAWTLIFSLIVNLAHDGNPAPLPFVPLINPLDLTLGLIVASVALWTLRLNQEGIDVSVWLPRELRYGVPAALMFIWANAIVLRTLHHWHGVPWTFDAMWHSTLVQAALSLLWAIIALAVMVFANRRAARVGWIAGATLLAIVVVKLFVVDLSRIGGIERIVSFIGVGVLLLLIGYLAPVPPRRKEGIP
jgi:uncharacterized membrane protein